MRTRTVLDGNAFYEIDEECMEQRRQSKRETEGNRQKQSERKSVWPESTDGFEVKN